MTGPVEPFFKKKEKTLESFPFSEAGYAARLVSSFRDPLNNSGVIPGKLAIASATRNPGISKHFWMPVFTGMTVKAERLLK
jgi:hypothetical protein